MNISQEVRRILDDHMISHGVLRLNASSISRHHAVTDHEKVYVKVLKHGSNVTARKLQTELDFAFNTNYGTNPLLEDIRHENSIGNKFYLSAWEYEMQIPLGFTLNPIQVAQAANQLYYIHSLPKYPQLITDSTDEFRAYIASLSSHSFSYLPAAHQHKIKTLFTEVTQPVTELLVMNPENSVICHGQTILEKIVARENNTVQWVDYEDVRAGPREYDLARVMLQLKYRLKRPDLWELFLREYENNLGHAINMSVFNQFAALHLSRRALILASTTLHTMNTDQLLEFLKELDPVLDGTPVADIPVFNHLH